MQANQENFRAGEIRQQNADAENTISNGSSGITFSAYSARQRSNDPLLMALYDRNQAAQSLGNGELSMMPTSDGMRGVQMQDLLYRPQEGDGAEMTLAGAAAANRRGLFSNASNIAFRDKIASINDPTEIALQQFDRLRQAGVVSYTQYADVLKGADQSREAYGRAIWNSLNAQTAAAIGSADPMVRNSQINAEYFARFSENPNAYWMGLATVASDLVGQGLRLTSALQTAIGAMAPPARLHLELGTNLPADLRTGYAGLAEGNLRVASDMLPIYDAFNNLGGYTGLYTIADVHINGLTGEQFPIPRDALEGYRLLDSGLQMQRGMMPGDAKAMFAASLNRLALHEQRDVLQPVYDSVFAGQTLRTAVNHQMEMFARVPGAVNPLTPNVLGTNVNPNDVLGNIAIRNRDLGDLNQRMSFVGAVADTFVNNLNRLGTSQTINFLGGLRMAPGAVVQTPASTGRWLPIF